VFDYGQELTELRTHTTEWLVARRTELIREQRRLHVEELAVTAVLDERGAVDDALAARDGVSVRSVRETVETARALEDLPEVAAAAFDGRLSDEQLTPVARLADASSDAEWARRAPNTAPSDLARLARTAVTPTMDEARARRAARALGFWWRRGAGMLDGRFSIPDLDGDLVERVFNDMIDRMRPAKGQPWETRARRGADALVQLCRDYAGEHAVATPNVVMVVEVPQHGPATVAGIPLPDEMVESLRAQARIEPVLVDEARMPIATGKARSTLSAKTLRAIRLRDGHCRWPGCDRRTGLQVHHLWPVSWGGTDERANLASVCSGGGTDHHGHLAPHGEYLLLGNPNRTDGLQLVHRDDLPALAALAAAEARAGPAAA
jgi:hypothetical protein